jgi:hypothetical protein
MHVTGGGASALDLIQFDACHRRRSKRPGFDSI